ncbi:hypothetical protein SUDANB95_01966 [Actinosynnema sp. ALI-1.44]
MTTRFEIGAPCWAHVATTDVPRTEAFYTGLFGWRAEPDDDGHRRLCLGDRPVAGVSPLVLPGRPDAWRMCVLVEDADQVARTTAELGGEVVVAPADRGGAGRAAVLRDPGGAVFEVWQARAFRGAQAYSEPGALCWFELATRDPAGAAEFYARLFGWTVGDGDWGGAKYARCALNGRAFGGIVAMSGQHPADVPSRWLVYFGSSDLRATVDRARALGATVGAEPVELPGGGGFVGLHDPDDAAFAAFALRPRAARERRDPALFEVLFDHDRYRVLAEREPVARVRYFDGSPAWLITRHADVAAVTQDPRVSIEPRHRGHRSAAGAPGLPEDFVRYMRNALGSVDPPTHTRLRRLVGMAFTPARVAALRPRVQAITDGLLDELARRPGAELVEEFAYPLAIQVICELIGVPESAREGWRAAASALLWSPPERIAEGARRILDHTADLITLRRADPGDDLLSELVRTRDEDGDRLSDDELVAMVITFLNAGHETTAHLVGNGVHALLTHPEQLALLRSRPDLLPAAVDELLRFTGPAELGIPRYATEPIEVAGTTIPRGGMVQVVYAAANRDPRRFADPDRLDVTRADNPHLGLGWGVHYCLGGHLGRAQAEIAIGTLLRRFPRLRLAVPADRVALRHGFARGLRALPVRWSADEAHEGER